MTDKTQPEALRLADWLQAAVQTYPQMSEDEPGGYASEVDQIMDEAAEELRRQHARIAGLETELEAVGAGGVQALSAAPAQAAPAPLSDDAKDAARYRWLRDFHHGDVQDDLPYIAAGEGYDGAWALTGEDADKAIDAALAAQGDTP